MSDDQATRFEELEKLLEAMPKIAEAVNSFSSEDVQKSAFSTLVATFSGTANGTREQGVNGSSQVTDVDDADEEDNASGDGESANQREAQRVKKVRKAPQKRNYAIPKDINFRPDGKTSLRDFAAEKSPKTLAEKNLLLTFYFEEFLEVSDISTGHILAGYNECGWKPSNDPANSLATTASKNRWLDTSNMKAITTTHSGRNYINFDMSTSDESK